MTRRKGIALSRIVMVCMVVALMFVSGTALAAPPDGKGPKPKTPPTVDHTPPEFALKDELILTWPQGQWTPSTWEPMWIEMVRNTVDTVQVTINVDSKRAQRDVERTLTQEGIPLTNVAFFNQGTDSVWVRDYGPIFVVDTDSNIDLVDWSYYSSRPKDDAYPSNYGSKFGITAIDGNLNFQGGNFQTDGNGWGYTSTVIYSQNPSLTPAEVDAEIIAKHGLTGLRVIPGLYVDGTKHIDMYVYIASQTDVIVADFPAGDINEPVADATAADFASWGFTVHRVDTPSTLSSYVISYTNGLAINDKVLVPTYGDSVRDAAAIQTWQNAFPGRTAVGIYSGDIISAGGTIHCVSMTRAVAGT